LTQVMAWSEPSRTTTYRTSRHSARPASTGTLHGPITRRRRKSRPARVFPYLVVIVVLVASTAVAGYRYVQARSTKAAREALPGTVWPTHGQAAFIQTGQSEIQAGPNQRAAPVA